MTAEVFRYPGNYHPLLDAAGHYRRQGLVEVKDARGLAYALTLRELDEVRCAELLEPARDTPLRRKRVGLRAVEDAWDGNVPLDALAGGAVWDAPRSVRRLRPHRRCVEAREDEEATALRRRAVVARAKVAPVDPVTEVTEPLHEGPEVLALSIGDWSVTKFGDGVVARVARAPRFNLLYVLDRHEPRHVRIRRLDVLEPAVREPTNLVVERLATLALAEVGAVGAQPEDVDEVVWLDLANVRKAVLGLGVVGLVDRQRDTPVIDGTPRRQTGVLEPFACAATASEVHVNEPRRERPAHGRAARPRPRDAKGKLAHAALAFRH